MRMRRIITLAVIIVIGVALRYGYGHNKLLWQDEAETTINSLQVLDVGYPHSTFRGVPIHENSPEFPSDDPKYAFASTNYFDTKFERNKGWLTYYYQAAFLKIFGFSTFVARLPFLLLFIPAALLLYALAKTLFGAKTAIIATSLFAVNPLSIVDESQARYYIVLTVLSIAGLYVTWKALQTAQRRYYILCTLILASMYYVHITAAIAFSVFIIAVHLYRHYCRIPTAIIPAIVSVALGALTLLPWIIAVRFWTVLKIAAEPETKFVVLLFFACVAICAYTAVMLLRSFVTIRFAIREFTPLRFLFLAAALVIIVKPFLMRGESIASRLFLETYPIACVLIAYYAKELLRKPMPQQRGILLAKLAVIALAVTGIGNFRAISAETRDTRWIESSLRYLETSAAANDTLVLVSYGQLSFQLYAAKPVELFRPLRKQYIDEYPGEIVFIMHLSSYDLIPPEEGKPLNFADRIQGCPETWIDTETVVLHCPKRL